MEVEPRQQYCLKWNNHKSNISVVFDRLRSSERFVDVTLASADQKTIKCHRILLSAGSGYLETILEQNPSDHPTIVLSTINYAELKDLVEFMYTGEVAIEQDCLAKLLEAARILKIKGLYEQDEVGNADSPAEPDSTRKSTDIIDNDNDKQSSEPDFPTPIPPVSKPPPQLMPKLLTGSQKRKRKSVSSVDSSESISKQKVTSIIPKKEGSSNPTSPLGPPPPNVFSPMFGISNAYFLTQNQTQSPTTSTPAPPPPLKTLLEEAMAQTQKNLNNINKLKLSPKSCSDNSVGSPPLPNLMPQQPLSPNSLNIPTILTSGPSPIKITTTSDAKTGGLKFNFNTPGAGPIPADLLSSAPVRRYKQYTEVTLQQALKDITEGQSINRSSMKYNIPARTLRDWMKRLNIKSVFTHHSQKDGRTSSADSNSDCNSEGSGMMIAEESGSMMPLHEKENGVAFPGMQFRITPLSPDTPVNGIKTEAIAEEEEEEEEIDDDEESNTLQISEEPQAKVTA